MTFLRYFCYIVAAALIASVVGGLFALCRGVRVAGVCAGFVYTAA